MLIHVKSLRVHKVLRMRLSIQFWFKETGCQRNISSQYYYRMLMSQNAEPVEKEMKELTASYQADKLEFIKNPVIAEFLGLSSNTDFTESELEQRSRDLSLHGSGLL